MDVPKLAAKIAKETVNVTYLGVRLCSNRYYHFFDLRQLRGFSGSESLSQVTSDGDSLLSSFSLFNSWEAGRDAVSGRESENVGSSKVVADSVDKVSSSGCTVIW